MNEQNMPQEQKPTNIWIVIAFVVITALVVARMREIQDIVKTFKVTK